MIVAVANEASGCGRTTVAYALASAAVQRGLEVALVDCDPRGRLTALLGTSRAPRPDLSDLASGRVSLREALHASRLSGVRLVPATRERVWLDTAVFSGHAGVVVIDGQPPDAGVRGLLDAVDRLLIPITLDERPLTGGAAAVAVALAAGRRTAVSGLVVTNVRLAQPGPPLRILRDLESLGAVRAVLPASVAYPNTMTAVMHLRGRELELAGRLLDDLLVIPPPMRLEALAAAAAPRRPIPVA